MDIGAVNKMWTKTEQQKIDTGNHGEYIDNIATGIMCDNIVEKADESVQNEHWSPQAWYHSHYNWVVP